MVVFFDDGYEFVPSRKFLDINYDDIKDQVESAEGSSSESIESITDYSLDRTELDPQKFGDQLTEMFNRKVL